MTDEYGGVDEHEYDFEIHSVPEISSASLGEWTVGFPITRPILLSGGTSPIKWDNPDGVLETIGLTIDTSGFIIGTPISTGIIEPTISAVDAAGAADTVSLSLTINPAVAVTTSELPVGNINEEYVQTLACEGGTAPIVWSDSDHGLDGSGLSLSPEGIISGMVTVPGAYEFTAQAEDVAGSVDFAGLDVIIYGPYACGDANGDGEPNIGDAVHLINCIFKGGPFPFPSGAGDANCDNNINVGDAVYLISYVFKGGPPPCCP